MASTTCFDCEDANFSGRQAVGKKELISNKKCAIYCTTGVVFGAAVMVGFFVLGPLFKHAMIDQAAVNRGHAHSLGKNFMLPTAFRADTRQPAIRAHPMMNQKMTKGMRVDDMVLVRAGDDKGKEGKILKIVKKDKKKKGVSIKVVVEGVNIKTKHVKPVKEGESGKKVQKEYPIDISNVKLLEDDDVPKASEPKEGDAKASET